MVITGLSQEVHRYGQTEQESEGSSQRSREMAVNIRCMYICVCNSNYEIVVLGQTHNVRYAILVLALMADELGSVTWVLKSCKVLN